MLFEPRTILPNNTFGGGVISDHRHIIAALAAHDADVAASLAMAHAAKAKQELIGRMLAKDAVASSAVA
ncbi:MAG TPA: hypothetical protein VEO36_00555 [Casimicrobiaceae bacterium]|nr:hypothetical protein [Casimicrobiaceae bacterium]